MQLVKEVNEKLTQYLTEKHFIRNKDVDLIISYGNLDGSDIDLFVLLTDTWDGYSCEYCNNLDIIVIGQGIFNKMMNNLDPVVTEPILTGSVIFGRKNLKKYQQFVKSIKPDKNTIQYLINRANESYKSSIGWYEKGEETYTLDNLLFTVSYMGFAKYYKTHKTVITYDQLKCFVKKKTLDLLNKNYKIPIIKRIKLVEQILKDQTNLLI